MAPHPSTLAWKNPMDRGAWWAAVHGVAKSWTRLSDFTYTFHFHALEKELAAHSSVLAWRVPGTGEPGGLLSMGSHRVGHDWSSSSTWNFSDLQDCLCYCSRITGSASSTSYLLASQGTYFGKTHYFSLEYYVGVFGFQYHLSARLDHKPLSFALFLFNND